MTDSPYRVVVEALAAQSVAIARLARELKIEFAQYQDAVSKRDNARANALAAAINERTAKLSAAADELEASVPNAEVDNSLPGGGTIDNTLPSGGDIDNTLPPPEGGTKPVEPVEPEPKQR